MASLTGRSGDTPAAVESEISPITWPSSITGNASPAWPFRRVSRAWPSGRSAGSDGGGADITWPTRVSARARFRRSWPRVAVAVWNNITPITASHSRLRSPVGSPRLTPTATSTSPNPWPIRAATVVARPGLPVTRHTIERSTWPPSSGYPGRMLNTASRRFSCPNRTNASPT